MHLNKVFFLSHVLFPTSSISDNLCIPLDVQIIGLFLNCIYFQIVGSVARNLSAYTKEINIKEKATPHCSFLTCPNYSSYCVLLLTIYPCTNKNWMLFWFQKCVWTVALIPSNWWSNTALPLYLTSFNYRTVCDVIRINGIPCDVVTNWIVRLLHD